MRKLFILLSLLNVNSFSQNLDIQKEVLISFEVPPNNPEYKELSKIFIVTRSFEEEKYAEKIKNWIYSKKYTFVNNKIQSDFVLSFETIDNMDGFPKIREDTSGIITKYYKESSHKLEFSLILSLPSGEKIDRQSEFKKIEVQGFSTLSKMNADFDYNHERDEEVAKEYDKMLQSTFKNIQEKYFIQYETLSARIYTVDNPNNYYNNFNKREELLIEWLKTNPKDLSNSVIQEIIEIFENLLKQYSPHDKSIINSELAGAIEYQLAIIYFCGRNYPSAFEHIKNSRIIYNLDFNRLIFFGYCKKLSEIINTEQKN